MTVPLLLTYNLSPSILQSIFNHTVYLQPYSLEPLLQPSILLSATIHDRNMNESGTAADAKSRARQDHQERNR